MLRGTLLAILLIAPALALAGGRAEAPWWESTSMDRNGDRVDDALPQIGADPVTVLVDVDHAATRADADRLDALGFPVVNFFPHFDTIAVRAAPVALPRLLAIPGVVFVEQDDIIRPLLKDSVPLIGAPQVWRDYGATGKGVVVAVLDDGADEQHPDLNARLAGSFDAATTSAVGPFAPAAAVPIVPAGNDGHGTHVAGTIVGPGTQSGGTYRGVAPDADFVDVKVFSAANQTSSDIVLRGLDWVMTNRDALHIRIASMSLGGRVSDGKDALSRAVNVAVDKGMIVVAAAGNAGPGAGTVAAPGAAEKAITVGAVDKQKRIAEYSSRGPVSDGRIKPDLMAPGTGIVSTVPPTSTTTIGGLVSGSREIYYGALSGTSMAAPHVSGTIALMLEVNPGLSPNDIKRILAATAQDMGTPGPDADSGYGFVNAIAAVQVAKDPTLLDEPQFASILGTLPEPAKESFFTRAQVEFDAAYREGTLPIYGGIAILLLALLVVTIVVVVRRARR